jgi:excisionase family DNA binding protein
MHEKHTAISDGLRAISLREFARCYGVGLTTAYEEIRAGRLKKVKIGKRSLILVDEAERWLKSLPVYEP